MAQVNKQAIAAAFGRAASQYEQHASLQQHSADALLTLLTGRQFASVLDAGCGPGRMSRYWRERGSEVTARIFLCRCCNRLAIVRRRITICWRISKRFPMTPKFLTGLGATGRSSGVAIYAMR